MIQEGWDREANTPTRSMPQTRNALVNGNGLYRGLIQLGTSVFWTAHETEQAVVYGLNDKTFPTDKPLIFETYPRYALKTLFGLKPSIKHIPSKRRSPLAYIDLVWTKIQELGYSCSSIRRPTVDQVDSMLCAIAADDLLEGVSECVGCTPVIDDTDQLIREGFIVVPGTKLVKKALM